MSEEKEYKVKIWWSDGEISEETMKSADDPQTIVDEWFAGYPEIKRIQLSDGDRTIGRGSYKRDDQWKKFIASTGDTSLIKQSNGFKKYLEDRYGNSI